MSLGLKVAVCYLALNKLLNCSGLGCLQLSLTLILPGIVCTHQRGGHHHLHVSQGGGCLLVNGVYLKSDDGKSCSEKSFCSWEEFLKVPFGHVE